MMFNIKQRFAKLQHNRRYGLYGEDSIHRSAAETAGVCKKA